MPSPTDYPQDHVFQTVGVSEQDIEDAFTRKPGDLNYAPSVDIRDCDASRDQRHPNVAAKIKPHFQTLGVGAR